jgi:hypothetical protein
MVLGVGQEFLLNFQELFTAGGSLTLPQGYLWLLLTGEMANA